MKKERVYKIGEKINDCVFIKELLKSDGRHREAVFKCKCGKLFESRIDTIKLGKSRGCGCRQGSPTHSLRRNGMMTPEYMSWSKMNGRCYNKNDKAYLDYGGRGILVCGRWRNSFENFIEDMGLRPSKDHSIDRSNNNGNYEPGNCKWSTKKEQARNRRSSSIITYNGQTFCIAEWAEKLSMKSPSVLWNRLYAHKWSIERAFEQPVRIMTT